MVLEETKNHFLRIPPIVVSERSMLYTVFTVPHADLVHLRRPGRFFQVTVERPFSMITIITCSTKELVFTHAPHTLN